MSTAEIPLFPLRLVLFPTVPQLLHVFEPRYRQLLTDCLAGDRRFGLPLLAEGADEPAPGDVGSSAVIQSHHRFPDGRANLLVTGETRFVIEEIVDRTTPYFVGRVQFFEDTDDADGLDRLATDTWQSWLDLQERSGVEVSPSPARPVDPRNVSFAVAGGLECEVDQKERWLRLTSTTTRLEELQQTVAAQRDQLERILAMADRARGNGHGDTPVSELDSL